MPSFKDFVKTKNDENKMKNQIPYDYTVVKIDDVIDEEFYIDMYNVYFDKDTGKNKVALALTTVAGVKYRIHTGAKRIVQIFEALNDANKDLADADRIDIAGSTYKITAIPTAQHDMYILE